MVWIASCLFAVFLLSRTSSLYILDISPLSDIWFANLLLSFFLFFALVLVQWFSNFTEYMNSYIRYKTIYSELCEQ